jgi:hypothetical protein
MFIRPMETHEIDVIINLFNYYKDDAQIAEDKYSENRVLATLREYTIRPHLYFRIALNGQRPIGVIGGFLSEDPVDTDLTATIQFNYLLPEFATVSNYGMMVEEFTCWAEACNATAIRAIDIGNNPNRLQDVYDELGFNPIRISIMNKELT